jgi:hypothetical protein
MIQLNGSPLEMVNNYKYLGVDLNNKLDWDHQWQRVQKLIASVPFLVKTLKSLRFPEQTLVTVFSSLALSHFIYSAPLLFSSNKKVKAERFQTREFKIIRISPTNAASKYNIITICNLLDKTKIRILKRVLSEADHPLTRKLPKLSRTRSYFIFKTNKARTTAISNSFVQNYIRTLRDASSDLRKKQKIIGLC